MATLEELKNGLGNTFPSNREIKISVYRQFFRELLDAIISLPTGVSKIENGGGLEVNEENGVVTLTVPSGTTGEYRSILVDGDFTIEELPNNNGYIYRIENADGEDLSWEIGGQTYTYGSPIWEKLDVEPLGPGVSKRIDVVYYLPGGDINYQKGSELEPRYPTLPNDAILKTFTILTPEGVEYETSEFLKKTDLGWRLPDSIGFTALITSANYYNQAFLNLSSEQSRNILGTHNLPEYDGAIYTFYISPESNGDTIFVHDSQNLNVSIPYIFPKQEDYLITPGETITFKYCKHLGKYIFLTSSLTSNIIYVGGNPFNYIKNPSNVTESIRKGDIAQGGWGDPSTYIGEMVFNTGDPSLISSWIVLRDITEIETN